MVCESCANGGTTLISPVANKETGVDRSKNLTQHKCAVGGLHKVAHDSGDGETIYHCPFCGSGQVIARSDRSIECEFCHVNFTVQVQPQFPAFPQTIDGMPVQVPGMPGQIGMDPSGASGGMPGDPMGMPPVSPDQVDDEGEVPGEGEAEEQEEEEGDAPPWAKQSLRTSTGQALSPEEFVRHVAIRHAADSQAMAQRVKESRR
jgi:hypothetical protein